MRHAYWHKKKPTSNYFWLNNLIRVFQYPDVTMSVKYAGITKTMLFCAFYHGIIPLGTVWTIIGLMLVYQVDKVIFHFPINFQVPTCSLEQNPTLVRAWSCLEHDWDPWRYRHCLWYVYFPLWQIGAWYLQPYRIDMYLRWCFECYIAYGRY